MTEVDKRIERVIEFKEKLIVWENSRDDKLREWLSRNVHGVRREVIEAGCSKRFSLSLPYAEEDAIMKNFDPFDLMFDRPYLIRMVPYICDVLDNTIGVLRNPLPELKRDQVAGDGDEGGK